MRGACCACYMTSRGGVVGDRHGVDARTLWPALRATFARAISPRISHWDGPKFARSARSDILRHLHPLRLDEHQCRFDATTDMRSSRRDPRLRPRRRVVEPSAHSKRTTAFEQRARSRSYTATTTIPRFRRGHLVYAHSRFLVGTFRRPRPCAGPEWSATSQVDDSLVPHSIRQEG